MTDDTRSSLPQADGLVLERGGLTAPSISVHRVADMFTRRVYSGFELLLHDLSSTCPLALLAPTDSVEDAA
ncbi:hypothetical protein ACNAW0_16155 [Micromonospora sp. SL1-18]|uniref:hypothetical protein n=1 Tax=Micromonospora sp. SL1-18 TaxID=3399128 RepID=UPI003A4E4266